MDKDRNRTVDTAERGEDGRFQTGNSGRRRGSRNRSTLAAEELLDGEALALTRRVVELGLSGDTVALRLCLDRLIPPRRELPVRFELRKIEKIEDVTNALAELALQMADGSLAPKEAKSAGDVLLNLLGALEIAGMDQRIAALEALVEIRS